MARSLGFEIEINENIDRATLRFALAEAVQRYDPSYGLGNEGWRWWTVKNEHTGHEFTSRAFYNIEPETFTQIHNILEHLRGTVRGKNIINRDCGLHVHIGIPDLTVAQIREVCHIFVHLEDSLFALQPKSRLENSYCGRITNLSNSRQWYENFNPDHRNEANAIYDHHRALSFSKFMQNGTIEFRHGASSIRGDKVVNWILTLLYFIEIAKYNTNEIQYDTTSLELFMKRYQTGIPWMDDLSFKSSVIDWQVQRVLNLNESVDDRRARVWNLWREFTEYDDENAEELEEAVA